jgi:hypothetical protein
MVQKIRRVVTGHDRDGRSTFLFDGIAANVKEMESMPGLALTDLWETTGVRFGERFQVPDHSHSPPPASTTRCFWSSCS